MEEPDVKCIRYEPPVRAPPSAIGYNKHMGGVDRADQLRAYYTAARKSQSWWGQILFFFIDIARVNAWICFKHTLTDRNHPADLSDDEIERPTTSANAPMQRHSNFVMDIAIQLIDGFAEGTRTQTATNKCETSPCC